MKYKELTIKAVDLVIELEQQAKLGFEVLEFLYRLTPNADSDFNGWKVLLVKRK